MKTKLYLLTALTLLTLFGSAQKYNYMIMEDWKVNAWEMSSKITYTYDSNGNLIKLTMEQWNAGTNLWDKYIIISYTLNSDATIKEAITQMWGMFGDGWSNSSKISYTYNGSKKILTETTMTWMMVSWLENRIETNTYDTNGNLIKIITQGYDFLTQQMKNSSQHTYSYNSDGTENQSIVQTWNALNQWENTSRMTNTYNASKQITAMLSENWVSDAWMNVSKMTLTYNTNGSVKETLSETWQTDKWVNSFKDISSYSPQGELEVDLSQEWNATLVQWENQMRTTYHYNTTGFQPVESAGNVSKVFPNPFEDQLTIEYGSLDENGIQVFNSTGQLVKSLKSTSSVTRVNLGSLNKGVYIMKIKSLQNEQTIRLLKVK